MQPTKIAGAVIVGIGTACIVLCVLFMWALIIQEALTVFAIYATLKQSLGLGLMAGVFLLTRFSYTHQTVEPEYEAEVVSEL